MEDFKTMPWPGQLQSKSLPILAFSLPLQYNSAKYLHPEGKI